MTQETRTLLLLGVTGFIYLIAGINFLYGTQKGMALAFIAYSISNVGMILASRGI